MSHLLSPKVHPSDVPIGSHSLPIAPSSVCSNRLTFVAHRTVLDFVTDIHFSSGMHDRIQMSFYDLTKRYLCYLYLPLFTSFTGIVSFADCQPVRFRCANKECISWAYHCDHANDCGCEGPGSDEHGCGGFNWSKWRVVIHIGLLCNCKHGICFVCVNEDYIIWLYVSLGANFF